MTRNLETLLQPQVAEYLMGMLGKNLNSLDVSRKLSDWQAQASTDGGAAKITATIKFDVPMTQFRKLVAEAARLELEDRPAA